MANAAHKFGKQALEKIAEQFPGFESLDHRANNKTVRVRRLPGWAKHGNKAVVKKISGKTDAKDIVGQITLKILNYNQNPERPKNTILLSPQAVALDGKHIAMPLVKRPTLDQLPFEYHKGTGKVRVNNNRGTARGRAFVLGLMRNGPALEEIADACRNVLKFSKLRPDNLFLVGHNKKSGEFEFMPTVSGK